MKVVAPAGSRDRRILLERMQETRDGRFNSPVITWVADRYVWAKKLESAIETPNPNVAEDGAAVYARPTRYWIRWRELDKARTRINDGGKILQITGTAEIGRRVRLELACKEWAHEQQ